MKKKMFTFLAGLFSTAAATTPPLVLTGKASFYAKTYIGKTMANGQPYNPRAFTLACDDLPIGTCVYISYRMANGTMRNAHATVTDRGPAQRLRQQGRIFDLSYSLFCFLEDPAKGLIDIRVQVQP